MKVTLLVVALNELEGMKAIMPKISKSWCDQIIILDGGSTDGTIEYAKESGYFVHVQKTKGLRNGYLEVYDLIEGDVLLTFSPDGNSVAERIPPLIDKMKEGYDMVIVSRYLGDAKSYDDDRVTAFGNWMFTSLINLLFGSRLTDAMVMFRAYKKGLIKELDLDKSWTYFPEKLLHTVISWEPMLSARCAKYKKKIAEIPGDEPPRLGGTRKLQIIRWGLSYLLLILADFVGYERFFKR